MRLLRCNEPSHERLLPRGVVLVDDLLLGRGVDRLEDLGEEFLAFLLLALLRQIHDLAHHRLHLRLKRLPARAANGVLTCAFDGGLDDRHGKREEEWEVGKKGFRNWERVGDGGGMVKDTMSIDIVSSNGELWANLFLINKGSPKETSTPNVFHIYDTQRISHRGIYTEPVTKFNRSVGLPMGTRVSPCSGQNSAKPSACSHENKLC